MRLLDRYLLRELLVPLGYCLGAFLIFWIAFDLFAELGDLQEHQMRAGDIAWYYVVKAPEFMVVVLPFALLLALLYTLTNHSRHHEITAIRAAGISLWRLALPYFGVGLLASLVLLALNELFVPDSADLAERIKTARSQKPSAERVGVVRDLGFVNERQGHRWLIGTFNERTAEMQHLQVDWLDADGLARCLRAAHAIHTNDAWVFFEVQEYQEADGMLVPGLYTNVYSSLRFTETPDEIRSEINISRRLGARKVRSAELPIAEILDYLRLHPSLKPAERSWLYTKLYGRVAAPWTCLVVVLIALPFGAASGRRNVFVGVASSIFICFFYYVLLQLGLALGAGGWVPAWFGAWAPNLTFGVAGVWLTARVR